VERKRKEETNTHALSPGGVGRRARAHDIHVNGPSKSRPKPCRHATPFCSLFLLHVHCVFNMKTGLVTRRHNPRRFSSINMYDCRTNKNSSYEPTNASRFLPPPLLHHQDFFTPIVDVHLRPGEQVPKNHPQRSCTGIERIRFLGSVLHDSSIASSSLSSCLVYLFIGRVPIVIICNALSSKLSGVFSTQPSSKKKNHGKFSSL
jgi:hypothetical protein